MQELEERNGKFSFRYFKKKKMKKVLLCFCLLTIPIFCFADKYTKGYYRKNGTYISGHYKSSSNNTCRDNYSYKNNYNPYTGKTGSNYYRNDRTSQYYNGYGRDRR